MKPEEIVERLAAFKHRGVATKFEQPTIDFLSQLFDNQRVVLQKFKTPKTYVVVVWWLIGGIVSGLLALSQYPILGMFLTVIFVTMALLYFNWYASLITKFPPQVNSTNIIVKDDSEKNPIKKVILMAHWDTAPISFLYTPQMVGNFRTSLKISLLLMILAEFVAVIHFLIPNSYSQYVAYALALYFLIQGITATVDFFRHGYSNGASDNATGVAAAIETAERIWERKLDSIEVELVLTGAEEVGMLGARAYFLENQRLFTENTYLINFDTLGKGDLKVITETGSWSNIVYENALTKKLKQVITQSADFKHITTGAWHTADFDSVWFQRAGMPCITLAALDNQGRMPNIHRPTDTLENVDFKPMNDAIQLAEKLILAL